MVFRKACLIILCNLMVICFFYGCATDDKKERLEDYLIACFNLNNKSHNIKILVYIDPGCKACNDKLRTYIDSAIPSQNLYILYISKYPDKALFSKWVELYQERVYVDRENIFSKLGINLPGSGKVILKNNKIKDINLFDPSVESAVKFIEN